MLLLAALSFESMTVSKRMKVHGGSTMTRIACHLADLKSTSLPIAGPGPPDYSRLREVR